MLKKETVTEVKQVEETGNDKTGAKDGTLSAVIKEGKPVKRKRRRRRKKPANAQADLRTGQTTQQDPAQPDSRTKVRGITACLDRL